MVLVRVLTLQGWANESPLINRNPLKASTTQSLNGRAPACLIVVLYGILPRPLNPTRFGGYLILFFGDSRHKVRYPRNGVDGVG